MSCYNDHIVIMFYHTNFGGAKFMHHNLGYKNTPVRLRRSFFFRTDAVFATSTTDRGIFIPQRYYSVNLSGRRWRKSKIISGDMECGSLKSMVLKWERYLIPISSKPSISDITISKFRDFSKNWTISMNKYICCCCEWLVKHYWALLKHDYSISVVYILY